MKKTGYHYWHDQGQAAAAGDHNYNIPGPEDSKAIFAFEKGAAEYLEEIGKMGIEILSIKGD